MLDWIRRLIRAWLGDDCTRDADGTERWPEPQPDRDDDT